MDTDLKPKLLCSSHNLTISQLSYYLPQIEFLIFLFVLYYQNKQMKVLYWAKPSKQVTLDLNRNIREKLHTL